MFKDKRLDDFIKLPDPDDSIDFFETVKRLSEKYWSTTDINKELYGFQIQKNTKWKDGLTDNQIADFEEHLKIEFPKGLRNFYKTMNGLDKPGVNVFGSDGNEHTFSPVYYSYPDDIEVIEEKIEWILESNNLTNDKLTTDNIPKIFPVTGHRFIVLDDNMQILSMYGDDIIYWAENISKLIANDIFGNIYNVDDFESNPANAKSVKFWLE
jgi:hypothetical protein